MLKNEKKQWISDDAYNFNQTKYLLHDSWMPKTILLTTNDGEVILENFDGAKADQLITAISSSGLKIIGSSEMETFHYENACVLTLKRKRRWVGK